MTPLAFILLTTIVAGHCWFIAAHARAWLLERSWAPYGRPTLLGLVSFLAILTACLLVPPAAVLILGAELTGGVLAGFLTNSIRTPWMAVAPRDLLLLRAPRPAAQPEKAQGKEIAAKRVPAVANDVA